MFELVQSMKNLKDYRNKELKYYAIINSLILILLSVDFLSVLRIGGYEAEILKNANTIWISLAMKFISVGLFSVLPYVFVFLMDSLISSEMKYRICYFPFGKKPGYTIFSQQREKNVDDRFTKEQMLRKYRAIYQKIDKIRRKNEKELFENSSWYQIYEKYREDSMIFNANRDYLLCRDLCVMSYSVSALYFLLCLLGLTALKISLVAFLFLEICATGIMFRIKGKRLALNVLTLDIHRDERR